MIHNLSLKWNYHEHHLNFVLNYFSVILKYLYENKAKFSPYIWLYSVHSQNSEVIQFLIENHILPKDDNYEESFIEAIKCHHNETANSINDKLLKRVEVGFYNVFYPSIKYYNFAFLHDNLINKSVIFDLRRYDYSYLVDVFI